MSEVPFDPELKRVESALESLVPARSRLDRDQLMFQAGVAEAQLKARSAWLWPAVAAGLATLAGGEALILATRPATRVVERVVVVREPVKSIEDLPAPVVILSHSLPPVSTGTHVSPEFESDALRLRRQVQRFGLDELPEPPLLTHSAGQAQPPTPAPLYPGVLQRPDYQKLIDSGGSS